MKPAVHSAQTHQDRSGSPYNTKISSEGRHRECPDLVCCILLLCVLNPQSNRPEPWPRCH